MKVLIVIPDSNIGGITTAAVNFCNELSQRGEDVTLLDMSGKYQCAELLDSTVTRGYLSGRSRFWNLQARDLKEAKGFQKIKFALLGIVKKLTIRSGLWYHLIFKKHTDLGEFDVAIGFRQCAPCYSFVLHKVSAKKKMGFVHGELTYMGNISSWKKHMHKLDKVAYVSDAVKNQFVEAYPHLGKNACTVYNMFNKEQILTMAKEQNFFAFDKGCVNIVTVARIDNGFKRIDWIPEICKTLSEKTEKQFHWYIVGDGPDKEAIEQKINTLRVQNLITVCGTQENPYAILKDADFSVLLSKSESYGLVVVESLILGVPAVVAEYPALKEILTNDMYGIVTKQNLEDATLKVLQIVENADLLQKMKNSLRDFHQDNSVAYQQFLKAINSKEQQF